MKQIYEHDGRIHHYDFTDFEAILGEARGEKWHNYRTLWHQTENRLTAAPKPLYITFATNSYCNLKCKMCMKGIFNSHEKEDISMELVDKFVNECRELQVPSINVTGAECTLNPNIRIILQKISESGAVDKFLFTNGTKLSEDFCDFLLDIGMERVYISLDAATSQTYQIIRGYDLDKVEKNINTLLVKKKERNSKLPIVRVSFVEQAENIHEKELFFDKWKDKVDVIDFQKLVDFHNLHDLKNYSNVSYYCSAPFSTLSVDYNGDIYPCCSGYSIHYKLGNLHDMSLYEAWMCDKIQQLRQSINEQQLYLPCKNCAAYAQ